jgi:galactosylceramidase
MRTLFTLVSLSAVSAASATTPPLEISSETCGRTYEGIGGLFNSDAPWLTAYPPKQLSEILDILFLPKFAASLQVLKLEIGGDGHSTINTESSHMHTESDPPSFRRGWILPLMREAVRRNPNLKVGGLAWAWPSWTKGSVAKKVEYLTTWAVGLREQYNVTLDFIGLQNEGEITGGPAAFSVALRLSLNAAGLASTLIECCDAHDWKDLQPLMDNHSSAFFHAVDALAVHEPLRQSESVPAAALATGKRIW